MARNPGNANRTKFGKRTKTVKITLCGKRKKQRRVGKNLCRRIPMQTPLFPSH